MTNKKLEESFVSMKHGCFVEVEGEFQAVVSAGTFKTQAEAIAFAQRMHDTVAEGFARIGLKPVGIN